MCLLEYAYVYSCTHNRRWLNTSLVADGPEITVALMDSKSQAMCQHPSAITSWNYHIHVEMGHFHICEVRHIILISLPLIPPKILPWQQAHRCCAGPAGGAVLCCCGFTLDLVEMALPPAKAKPQQACRDSACTNTKTAETTVFSSWITAGPETLRFTMWHTGDIMGRFACSDRLKRPTIQRKLWNICGKKEKHNIGV